MMKYLSRRILVLTALYVVIIFGIFALQFTNGNAFSQAIGSMMVSGTMENDSSGTSRPVLPLHISVNGIDFFLDDQNSLIAFTSEKTAVRLKVTGFIKEESRFTVNFTDNVSVSFASVKRANADIITILGTLPEKYPKVVFPYKTTRSARVEKKESLSLINTGKKQYVFTGASIEPLLSGGARALSILRASPVVYYQTYIPAKGLLIEDLLSLPAASDLAYKKAVEQFAASSLVVFKQSIASGSFSEPLVESYIAEMGRIGMYRSAIESIPEVYRNGSGRTWQTVTFLDNLEKTYAGLIAREREDRLDLSRKISENNPAVFEFPSLIPYLLDRGSSILLKDLARFASVIDISAITAREAAGILEAAMDLSVYLPKEENALLPLAEACERKLKTSLVRINDDLYTSDDGKTIDTLSDLEIGPILIRYGSRFADKAVWKSVGNLLVTSMVSFTGGKAALPSGFSLAGGASAGEYSGIVAKSDAVLDLPSVYPVLVSGNTWYPHALSLSAQAGPGVWAWTSAQSIKVTRSADNIMKITTQFPQGETHYMILRGIKSFYRILIYGIDFRTDPRFESYNSSGYVYNEQTETLYLKMRHKAEFEDVLIYTGPNPDLSAAAAPASAETPAAGAADGSQ